MNHPRKHKKPEPSIPESDGNAVSATADLDAFEAQAQPYRRILVEEGKLVPVDEFRKHLATTGSGANNANMSSMFTVDIDGHEYYPVFFLSSDFDAGVLAEITALLARLPGWSLWHFFTSANASLGAMSPLEMLREGQVERVRRAALAFADR